MLQCPDPLASRRPSGNGFNNPAAGASHPRDRPYAPSYRQEVQPMRTTQRAFVALTGAAVAAVLGVTACNNDHSTAPPAPLLSQVQAESLAKTVVADIAGAVSTATMDG